MIEHIPKKNPHTIQPTLLTLSTSNRSSTQQVISPYNPIIINPTNQFNYLKNQIEIIGKRYINLTQYVNLLYRSVLHCDRKIYGVRVYTDKDREGKEKEKEKEKEKNMEKEMGKEMEMENQMKKDSSDGKQEEGRLEKVELDYKTKLYICSCEMFLNQNPISPTTLSNYLKSLPTNQNELDQIRLQPPFLKFQKHNLCLSLCLISPISTYSSTESLQFQIPQIQKNQYLLDSYDREGKNYMAMIQCYISFGWVQVEGSRYFIGGFVRNVTAIQGFVAVVSEDTIGVICLAKKKIMKFQVQDCVDAKWGYRGLYYLQRNGQVGLLQRQTAFIPSFNTFTQILLPLPPSLLQTSTFTPEYHPQRLCPVSNLSSNNSLFLLSVHSYNPKKFLLQQIYSNKYGMKEDIYAVVEMKDIEGTILYKNMYAVGSEIRIGAVVGRQQGQKGSRQMEYWEYRVSTI